jgi:hypothetical protein
MKDNMSANTIRTITCKGGFICLLLFLLVQVASAQQTSPRHDPEKLYESLKSFSEKGRVNGFMYDAFFTASDETDASGKPRKPIKAQSYQAFEGKVIRKIYITPLNPFGYSVSDTSAVQPKLLQSFGNDLHIKSRRITIRNLLLIRQNQRFDSLLVRESERLVRSRDFVRDVAFDVRLVSENSDSVDVFIRELDAWSIIPKVRVSAARTRFSLSDYNILGLGHESRNELIWNHTTGDYDFNTSYHIANFRNTYISATLTYGNDGFGEFTKGINVERPFFSAYTRWAGGANVMQQIRYEPVSTVNLPDGLRFKVNVHDYWVGKASKVLKGQSEYSRTTSLITTARYYSICYLEKPTEMYGTETVFSGENLYLASLGLATRKYIQDRYLFRYGVIEDVAVGTVASVIGGVQHKNGDDRLYLGSHIAYGAYNTWGYLGAGCDAGTFFKDGQTQQGSVALGLNYFTPIYELGKYRFRQFIKTQAVLGFDRFNTDSLCLNNVNGWGGFNSPILSGTHRLMFTMQTQSYTPWNLLGFRFGPYLNYSCGMIGDADNGFKKSKLYSQIGIGVLIKNENLVFKTFQVSVSFYPSIPGIGQDVYKFNSFRTTDFGIPRIEVGKPELVNYK